MTAASGLASALASRLQALWGTAVEVTGVRPLPGGASRESWDVQARTPSDAQADETHASDAQADDTQASDAQADETHASHTQRRLILLRDAGGQARPDRNVAVEAAAMIAARAAGVPVAELYDYGRGALGQAYLLMERLDGETIPRRLLRDEAYATARAGLAHRLGEVLARIHQVDPDSIPGLPHLDALGQVTELYEAFAEPRPALEIGLRWLAEHRPAPAADALVHGDFRIGNLMVGEDGLRGVLDWELAHRGDPRQDLGWLCTKAWRFGSASPVGGFGTRADLMSGYAAGGGVPPDEGTQRWWELYGTMYWALLCRRQAERYLADAEPSIELAVLGRRVCEQEYDILLALGYAAPLTVTDPLEDLEGKARTPGFTPRPAGRSRIAPGRPRIPHRRGRFRGRHGSAPEVSRPGRGERAADRRTRGHAGRRARTPPPGQARGSRLRRRCRALRGDQGRVAGSPFQRRHRRGPGHGHREAHRRQPRPPGPSRMPE